MNLRFQADADLRFAIVNAVRQREPGLDFASSVDAQLAGVPDPTVLQFCADHGRILVTHDFGTMLYHFRARLDQGLPSPGLLVVAQDAPLVKVVNAIVLVWAASDPTDWANQVHHLPSLSRHAFQK